MQKEKPYYGSNLTNGALMVRESRLIAQLLLDEPDLRPERWHEVIIAENILQKRSPHTAKVIGRYLRTRLELAPKSLLPLIADGDAELAAQASLAAALKNSRLLSDYMDHILRTQRIRRHDALERRDWIGFLENATGYANEVEEWSESVRQKLGQVVHKILAEAHYLENTRSKKIQSVQVRPEIRTVLDDANEAHVLRCMEVCA